MSGIASIVCYLTLLIALVAAVSKIRQANLVGSAAGRYLASAIMAFGLATALFAPATLSLAVGVVPLPNIVRLTSNALTMVGAFCMVATLIQSRRSLEYQSRRLRQHALLLMVCIIAMTSFVAAGETEGSFSSAYASNPWIITYTAVLTGYNGMSLVVFIWLARREARLPETRRLVRAGLRVAMGAAGIGLAWVLWMTAFLVTGWGVLISHEEVTALLMAIGITTLAAGGTLTTWGPWVLSWAGRLRAWWALRALKPLWTQLADARQLVAPSSVRASDIGRQGAVSALHRRVVAIRDVQLALRPFVHPDLRKWVGDAVRRHGLDQATAAIISEAAEFGAALDACIRSEPDAGPATQGARWVDRRRNARRATDPVPPPDATLDLLAEARRLVQVGLALHTSSIVDELRHRARAVSPSSPR